jgi:predicted 3-demethylubiquinone-9 3-methyltransferase (glyoxalase superfamily)
MVHQEMAICLWFDSQAEEAANFYTKIFQDSEIIRISRFGKEGFEYHGKPEGAVMAVDFRLNQLKFVAVNGNHQFRFNESVSVVLNCDTQEEIDHYWSKLSEGGTEQQCGWLKDKFGVSWQITPTVLAQYFSDADKAGKSRVANAMFQMKKFDIEKLRKAYEGK